jgi:hypothetical protein
VAGSGWAVFFVVCLWETAAGLVVRFRAGVSAAGTATDTSLVVVFFALGILDRIMPPNHFPF